MEKEKYLIPEESIDTLMTNVSTLRTIEGNLRKIFLDYKYQEVLMPSFEYVNLYTSIDQNIDLEKLFQYINHEGKNVAMRFDFTIPLARLYANSSNNGIGRYCYFGKVFRKEKIRKGRSSEFYQGGIELINKPGLEGDLEALHIIKDSLPYLQLGKVLIDLGSAKFYNRLIELNHNDKEFKKILKFRNISGMKKYVKEHNFDKHNAKFYEMIPTASGTKEDLEEMISLCPDVILKDAIQELVQIEEHIDMPIEFDLCMVPEMNYYTGLMIKGYSQYSANAVITGGRYDKLLSHFDSDASAIGFCYHLQSIMKAIEKEGEAND